MAPVPTTALLFSLMAARTPLHIEHKRERARQNKNKTRAQQNEKKGKRELSPTMNAFWCALVVALGLAMGASELNIGDRVSTERATPSMLEQEVKNLENPSSEYMGKFARIPSCKSCNCTFGNCTLPPACCKPSDPGAGARCKSVTTGN
jgi:hypothetical protein